VLEFCLYLFKNIQTISETKTVTLSPANNLLPKDKMEKSEKIKKNFANQSLQDSSKNIGQEQIPKQKKIDVTEKNLNISSLEKNFQKENHNIENTENQKSIPSEPWKKSEDKQFQNPINDIKPIQKKIPIFTEQKPINHRIPENVPKTIFYDDFLNEKNVKDKNLENNEKMLLPKNDFKNENFAINNVQSIFDKPNPIDNAQPLIKKIPIFTEQKSINQTLPKKSTPSSTMSNIQDILDNNPFDIKNPRNFNDKSFTNDNFYKPKIFLPKKTQDDSMNNLKNI